jgi:hypothetical protein
MIHLVKFRNNPTSLFRHLVFACLLTYSDVLLGFCEDISEYSLQTFQWSEQHTNLKIRRLWAENTLESSKTNLEYAKIDLNNANYLFLHGYITLSELENMQLTVDEAALGIKKGNAKLKSMDGDLDILARRVQETCAQAPLPSNELHEVAAIYSSKWQEQVNNDLPEMNLTRRKLKSFIEFRDYKSQMFKKGYISNRELLDAEYHVILMRRRVKTENLQIEIKRAFIEQLTITVQ